MTLPFCSRSAVSQSIWSISEYQVKPTVGIPTFLSHRLKQHCILGNDYYRTNEHRVFADGHTESAGEVFGYSEITRQYYNRYRVPVMHTETNLWEGPHGDEAVKWLWKEWANVLRLRNVGIPTVGFTWYSLTDQVDWDTALREQNGNINPLGLYDLDRNIRNVGKAYKQLIRDWREVLPASSVCLTVPLAEADTEDGVHFDPAFIIDGSPDQPANPDFG